MKRFIIGIAALALVSVFANSYFLYKTFNPSLSTQAMLSTTYPLLSPRIFAQRKNDILINFINLRQTLTGYVSSLSDPFGVYFEYLPSGVSIGVNENKEYILVSLLKVPLVMAVYKNVEQGTTKLSDTLTITEKDKDNKFGSLYKEPNGTQVSVQDAIKYTLEESDNTAKNLLGHTITNDDIGDVFDYLDIPKDTDQQNLVVSPKNYSSIMRSLYLSSYLDPQDSSQLLNFLTHSIFTDKLPAGIPAGVPVAHKIGVFDQNDGSTPVFTDCGIVYVPSRPYILCMMTKSQESKAQEYMKTVSIMVYQYVATANR